MILTIGDNMTRKNLVGKVSHAFDSVIHPSAVVSNYAQVGEGSVVFHGSILQSGAKIGTKLKSAPKKLRSGK